MGSCTLLTGEFLPSDPSQILTRHHRVLNPFDLTRQENSTQAGSGTGNGLSTGAKVGIGVAVPLGVIAIAIIALLFFRGHRRPKVVSYPPVSLEEEKHESYEKPELVGDPYDPVMGGPIKWKPELEGHTISTATSPVPPRLENHTLSSKGLPVSPELENHTISTNGLPISPELENHTISTNNLPISLELADNTTSLITSHELPSTTHATTTPELPYREASSTKETAAGNNTASSRKPGPHATAPAPVTQRPEAATEGREELTEEADSLVSELGVIQKRKRTLTTAATAAGVSQPENVEGRKGDEYRKLIQREQSVRERMAEVQEALKTGSSAR